jgi:hypothetical protein
MGIHTVEAVRDAEWHEIAARKPLLAAMAERNALLAAQQMGDALAKRKYPIGSLPVVFGVSVDKAINLRADPTASIQQHLHLHLSQNNVTANFNSLLERLEDKTRLLPTTTHPDCPEVIIDATESVHNDATDDRCLESNARAEKVEPKSPDRRKAKRAP